MERNTIICLVFLGTELIVLLICLLAMSIMTESDDDSSCNAFEITQILLSSDNVPIPKPPRYLSV